MLKNKKHVFQPLLNTVRIIIEVLLTSFLYFLMYDDEFRACLTFLFCQTN